MTDMKFRGAHFSDCNGGKWTRGPTGCGMQRGIPKATATAMATRRRRPSCVSGAAARPRRAGNPILRQNLANRRTRTSK